MDLNRGRVFLIDGNSYIHRAYHALPPLTTSSGLQVNAIYGFIRMLLKIVKNEKPDYIAVCFDSAKKTFRHNIYPEYKATRAKTEDALVQQIPFIKKIVQNLGLKYFECEGYEADDIIATIIDRLKNKDLEIIIVSGDKDVLQLVSDNIKVLNENKNILFDKEEVFKVYGVYPEKLIELFSLSGDNTDNIPGIPGIGEKTALQILKEYGSIKNIIEKVPFMKENLKKKIQAGVNLLDVSSKLIELRKNVPIEFNIDDLRMKKPDSKKLLEIAKELEFTKLLKEYLQEDKNVYEKVSYKTILKKEELQDLLKKININKIMAIEVFDSDKIKGISIATSVSDAFYIPFEQYYFNIPVPMETDYLFKILKEYLESDKIIKYTYNLKELLHKIDKYNIKIKNVKSDIMLAGYLINPEMTDYSMDILSIQYLGESLVNINGNREGKNQMQILSFFACDYSCRIFRLTELLNKLLEEKKLYLWYVEVEIPFAYLLFEIEKNGVKIDREYLFSISNEFNKNIEFLSEQIYKHAGQRFNINSPKQLSFILFEKHKLPVIAKTKKGYSTSESVLKVLSTISPIAKLIIEYRELQKLKTTYVDTLIKISDNKSSRVYTHFNQTGTATGRLSSAEPNLQNIPARTESGRKIRKIFISENKNYLVSADYSQIDLRVLAHISEDKLMLKAFEEGEDIHLLTACEIFGITKEKVTSEIRRIAKTINFGIIYGMSAFGLSEQLGITKEEAHKYIENYFKKYSGVQEWIKKTLEFARINGYVRTVSGRIRYIHNINSQNSQLKSMAERVAINTPVQGTSADIIKIAMLNVFKKVPETVKILVQVHDELLFEIPEELLNICKTIKSEMENAFKLKVPLIVEIKYGKNWCEMKQYEE